MAISEVVAGAPSQTVGVDPATTPALPATPTTADLLVVHDVVVAQANGAVANIPGTPAGWTQKTTFVATMALGGQTRHTWFYRPWASGLTAPTITLVGATGTQHRSIMVRVRGAKLAGDPTDVLAAQSTPAGSATVMGPITGLTTTAAGGAVLLGCVRENDLTDGSTIGAPGTPFATLDSWGAAAGENMAGALASALTNAGAVTDRSFSISAPAADRTIGQMWALLPEPTSVDHAGAASAAGVGSATAGAGQGHGASVTAAAVGAATAAAGQGHTVQASAAGVGSATAHNSIPAEATAAGVGSATAGGTLARAAGATAAGQGGATATARIDRPPLNVSLWAVGTGGTLTPLPGFAKLDFSRERNAVGSVSVDYPAGAAGFSLLRAGVVDDRDVEVEIWLGGRRTGALRALLEQTSGDDLDARAVWTFSGAFLERLLAQAIVYHQAPPAEKGELVFSGRNAGQILATVVDQAQARGALAGITRDWTTAVDSTGFAWPQTVSTLKFSPRTTVLQVCEKLVELDLAEFEVTADRVLKLWAPGRRGVDRSLGNDPATFRHGRVDGAPIRHSVRESGTVVLVAGADGIYREASDATAQSRRGRRIEVGLDANNLADATAVSAFASKALTTVTPGQNEIRHGLTFGPGDPRPGAGFDLADKVISERAGGVRLAVGLQQYTLAVTRTSVTGEVVLKDRIASRLERVRRQLDAIGSGAAVIGTSQPPPTEDRDPPAVPLGVTVSSLAYATGDGGTLAEVLVGWTAVTTNADGTAADDISGYRVEWRLSSSTAWRLGRDVAGASAASTSFGGVSAGQAIVVRVAAYDTNGNQSAYSAEVAHTTQTDSTAPPVPSTPTAFSRLGVLMVEWDGLGSVGEAMPPDFDYVEVHMSTASNFAPTATTYYDRLYAAGTMPVVDQAFGVAQFFKLVAVDRTTPVANRSGASAQATATPSKVVSDDIFAGAVGSLALADLAVKTAKIDNLAVNDAQFGSGSFGKITAGVMSVAMTLTGIIRTATTGLRWEGDSAGIRFYNASGVETIRMEGAAGNTTITGTLQSAVSGTRWVMHPLGELRLYSSTGTDHARIYNFNDGNDVVLRGRLDVNSRSGRFNAGPLGCGMNFSSEAEIPDTPRAEIVVDDRRIRTQAPVTTMRINRQLAPPDGGTHRIELFSGDATTFSIGGSRFEYLYNASGGSGENVQLRVPALDSNIAYRPGVLLIRNTADSAYIPINASAFNVNSSTSRKRDVTDVGIDRATMRAKVKAVVPKRYRLTAEVERPARPGTRNGVYRMAAGEKVRDAAGRPIIDYVDEEWAAPMPPARERIGFLAENLRTHFPDLVEADPADPAGYVIDVVGALAILWRQVADLVADTDPPAVSAAP